MSTQLALKPSTTGRATVHFSQSRDIFEDFESLTTAITQRAFGFFRQRGSTDGHDWLRAESELLKPMPIEMSESNDGYIVRAEVPGFNPKDLSIRVESNAVYVHGKSEQKKEEKSKKVQYSEVLSNEICRRIDLPGAINTNKASAYLENGVLELSLPKGAPQKSVEVKVA